ncbi:hypothetical protein [Pseudomonas aeruginosa]|uniref:hypothetical protein n=1 Tax=Pseudomonas aeruginosa TaxID=287 RepID=UPI0003D201E4|nr:hypothetical protein [Pseudomonas aeruginosa]AHB56360.1 hypothetical protein U769_15630 [Pseudomonas aeruginosa MTB-1]MBI7277200.1 hypothetical protein [Pseudomonas aeruginosa]RIZ48171.1 hypothetical protein AXX02_22490 [Pseudomonas aeruginosa]
MSKFKSGDMALVVGGNLLLGCEVELIKWVEPGQTWAVIRGTEYVLDPSEPGGGWHVRNATDTGIKEERFLMPLRGDFQPEQQKAKEVEA